MSLDIPKIIEAIKSFNKPLVFLVFGLLAYWAIPLGILGLQLDWIPKVKVIGLLSIFVGIALGAQSAWECIKAKNQKRSNTEKIKKTINLLNDDENKIIRELVSKGSQSCTAPINNPAYFSLVSKKIAFFGETKTLNRYFDFHITDEVWEILERSKDA